MNDSSHAEVFFSEGVLRLLEISQNLQEPVPESLFLIKLCKPEDSNFNKKDSGMPEIALDSILATSRCKKESNSQRKTAKAQMDLYLYQSQAATNYLPTALNTSQRKTRQGLY